MLEKELKELYESLPENILDYLSSAKFDYHGGPYDRGGADSYYRRRFSPHKYPNGTGRDPYIPCNELSAEELLAYFAGYQYNEKEGNFKDY